MKFKTGQKIVCIAKGWQCAHLKIAITNIKLPDFNEVVTCDGYEGMGLYLKEYNYTASVGGRSVFDEKFFRPVLNIGDEVEEYILSNRELEHN